MKDRTPSLLLALNLILITNGQREHKVHNIVLYPDKNSWCKTLPIKQIISYPDYKSEEIDNNVCVGACFSYSIPHAEPSDPGEAIVPYCDSCQPFETTWKHVTLQREIKPDDDDKFSKINQNESIEQHPSTLLKRVQIIKNCSCTQCDKLKYSNNNNKIVNTNYDWVRDYNNVLSYENDNSIESNDDSVPVLINMLNNRNHSHIKNNDNLTNKFTDFIEIYKLLEKFNYLDDINNDNNIDSIDSKKLNEIITILNHKNNNNNNNNNNEAIDKSKIAKNKFNHHIHHVGDIISGHGHLVHGPHGSLIVQPDIFNTNDNKTNNHLINHTTINVKNITDDENVSDTDVIEDDDDHDQEHEKLLDVNSHELIPNHAGTMLSYSSHSQQEN